MRPKLKTLAMMPFYVRDHLIATRHMTLAERGAYFDLLCVLWDSQEPLPKDPDRLSRLVGCSKKEFAQLWPVLRRKFIEKDGGLVSRRLEIERQNSLEMRRKSSEKASKAARERWHPDATSNAPSISAGMPGAMHEDCPPAPAPSPAPVVNINPGKRLSRQVVDERDPEVQKRRRQAAALARTEKTREIGKSG
jgi:uncharacterized protein YdaU (DUF1376 family)